MKYIFALLLGFTVEWCFSQQAYFLHDIDSIVHRYITENDFPSAAVGVVGVVYGDSVLYEKRILNETDPNGTDQQQKSIYNIASVAKPLVATAILMLEEEGKIDITLPVVDYLPDFKISSKFNDKITLEHLLTHTSGLPNTSKPDDYQYLKVDTTDQALSKHIATLSSVQLAFKPGKKYAYSNVGYEVLGQIIAQVSGMSFDAYMHEKLFKPLQMERTSYLLSEFSAKELAMPHEGHPIKMTEKFPYNRAFSPSGNLFTSIADINKWMIFNLNDGKYSHFRPISPSTFRKLMTPRVPTDEDDFVGLSWFMKNGIIFHDGLDMGYSALMILYKRQQFGITVLINHQEADCNELLNLIAKAIKF